MFFMMFIVNTYMHLSKPQKIQGLNEISNKYDIYFVDLWGVMHNGVECYPEAINVLEKLKKNNKKIILISNAPRLTQKSEIGHRGKAMRQLIDYLSK